MTQAGTPRPVIRTPDRRLRVFVSSTLAELAPERRAARAAVERLGASPIMFEIGARPHPPRALYRSYLQQSDVFVGIYWERYGWVAPGETVSGLEDEYDLVPPGMPRLVYLKDTAGAREPRLETLLERIRDDDTTSYKAFRDDAELGELLVADLAVLLAERFDASRAEPDEPEADEPPRPRSPLPQPLTELIGRVDDVRRIRALVLDEGARLVTLTGPGGVGKSRLAIAAAVELAPAFPDGTGFVALAAVRDAAQVPAAMAEALGVSNPGDRPLEDKLATAFRHRRFLLVLDNFEHVLPAAALVADLLAAAPQLVVLVTSRTLLALSGEHRCEVRPLGLPTAAPGATEPAPAVRLFVARARAVRPDFELTAQNRQDVEAVVVELDGVPLAIELAAARIRLLSPGELRSRLDRRLVVLAGGPRDLPERQRTLRATLDWSTQLLSDDERRVLARLGAFAGSFGIDAAEHVVAPDGVDALAVLGALVDSSLLQQEEQHGRTAFRLLRAVRDYAIERLASLALMQETLDRHASYYVDLASRMQHELDGASLPVALQELAQQHDDLRAAARHLLDRRDWDTLTGFTWSLFVYWWLGGHLGEVRDWMAEALASDEPPHATARAMALFFTGVIGFWQRQAESVAAGLRESVASFADAGWREAEGMALVALALAQLVSPGERPAARESLERSIRLFRGSGFGRGEEMALTILGRADLADGDLASAAEHFEQAVRHAETRSDDWGATVALFDLGSARVIGGDLDGAAIAMERSLRLSIDLGHQEGVAYGLEGFGGIAAARGQAALAGRLLGAAEALRERIGRYNPAEFAFHAQAVARVEASPDRDLFRRAFAEGRVLPVEEAVALALTPGREGGGA
jgi:predicted ATPase